MPKVVDHDARRAEIAAALWRVVMRDGLEAASVRRVAAEAGWSTGSLRHYFSTQGELLAFAMELVVRRATERITALPTDGEPREVADRILREVLPLDDERRAEMQVWLAFAMHALVDPDLHDVFARAHANLRGLCVRIAETLGSPRPARDGERLHAFVDGLALHAVVAPDRTTPRRMRALLRDALASLV